MITKQSIKMTTIILDDDENDYVRAPAKSGRGKVQKSLSRQGHLG